MKNAITIIVAFRNRETERIVRFLDSLNNQTCRKFNLIFVDSGSDIEISNKVKDIVESYSFASYFYNETRGMLWNKSNALNIALKRAEGDYILQTDIDLIFSPNIIEYINNNLKPDTNILCPVFWLPEKINDWNNLQDLIPNLQTSEKVGTGGVNVIKKSILLEINGWDEHYCYWGGEDTDLHMRLQKYGVEISWMDPYNFPVFHQWHSSFSTKQPTLWYNTLINYMFQNNSIKRNLSEEWGVLYTKENRFILKNDIMKSFKKSGKKILWKEPRFYLLNYICESFYKLNKNEICYFEYHFEDKIQQGKLSKIINLFNKYLNHLKFNYLFIRKEYWFDKPYLDLNDIKNIILFFIGLNKENIKDYYFKCENNTISLILARR